MPTFLTEIFEAFSHPAERHAIFVHFPVVLSIAAMASLIVLAVSRGKSSSKRRITLIILLLGVLFCKLAENAGENAVEALTLPLTPHAGEVLGEHEEAAESLMWIFAGTAVLVALTWFKLRMVRYPAIVLAVIAGLVLMVRVAMVAHLGGELVYKHGVGVPASPNNVQMQVDE